jgi:chaperonin GroES
MIKPIGDRVLIKPITEEEKTPGGIFIPDTAKEKPQEGEVVDVGSGRTSEGKKIEFEVKKGDRVIFSKYAGTEIKHNGVEYLILKESDILAIVEDKKKK